MERLKNKLYKFFSIFVFIVLAILIVFIHKNNIHYKENKLIALNQQSNRNIVTPNTLDELKNMDYEQISQLSKLDMRKFNLVTPVKNQGAEGICWAYAMAAASEVNMLYKGVLDSKYNNNNFGLSSTNIDTTTNRRNGNYDKLGLTDDDVINLPLKVATPLMFLKSQMFSQQNAPIIGDPHYNAGIGNNAAWLGSIVSIPNNEMEIKKAISKYGAVAFAYKHSGYTAYYPSGDNYEERNPSHAATIVGWDDDYMKEKFLPNKPKRNGAWIVKNSWGEHVYDRGYFYLAYDSYISDIIAFDYKNKEEFHNSYYYDGTSRMGPSATIKNKKAAAIFPVKIASETKKEFLKGVSFGLLGENARVKATVYMNVDNDPENPESKINNPESGVKVHEELSSIYSNKGIYGGRYTMTFNKEIELTAGSYFSIVLEPINNNNTAQLLFASEPRSNNDLTYFKEGNEWINSRLDGNFNVATIKGLTINKPRDTIKNDLLFSDVNLLDNDLRYTEEMQEPNINVKYKGITLSKDVDYSINYSRTIIDPTASNYDKQNNVATLKIVLTGKGNYSGEKVLYYKIKRGLLPTKALELFGNEFNQATNTIQKEISSNIYGPDQTFSQISVPNGFEIIDKNKPILFGQNYNKVRYTNNDASCFEITEFNFNVNKKIIQININDVVVTPLANINYTGKEIQPDINLVYNGNVLIKGVHYDLYYENNINVGTATIKIKGKDGFIGEKNTSFEIVKAKNEIINWDINDKGVISFESNFGSNTVLYKYFSDKECLNELPSKPTTEGEYYVKAYIPATDNYESLETNAMKFTISKQSTETNNLPTFAITLIVIVPTILIGVIVFFIIKKVKSYKSKK